MFWNASDASAYPDGRYLVEVEAFDSGSELWGTGKAERDYTLDRVPPTIAFAQSPADAAVGENGWTNVPLSVSLSASDATSGVRDLAFAWDDPTTAQVYAGAFAVPEGEHTLFYSAEDQAGNSIILSELFRVETGLPDTFITPRRGGDYSGRSLFSVRGADTVTPTPVLRFSHRVDGGVCSPWNSSFVVMTGLLPAGLHTLEVRAKDLAGNVDPTPASETSTVTDARQTGLVNQVTPGALRNALAGWAGMQLTTGDCELTVSELGRWMVEGNIGTHPMRLVHAQSGSIAAAALVDMAGGMPGQFQYAPLSAPVVLAPRITYYLVSRETAGGDAWLYSGTTVATTLDATVDGAATFAGQPGVWRTGSVQRRSYGAVSLRYGIR